MINYVSCYSGAGFKISHHAGVKFGESLLDPQKYNCLAYFGVSSGSIIQFATNIVGIERVKERSLVFTANDVFYQDPMSFSGKVSAGLRIVGGKLYLYDQSKLYQTLKQVVSKKEFEDWVDDLEKPPVYAVAVDIETAEIVPFNLKTLSYEDAILAVMASSSIPVFTEPISIFGRKLVDGGLRTHCPSPLALDMYKENIDLCLSVYSRPQEIVHYKYKLPDEKIFKINVAELISRVLDISNLDVSDSDERLADKTCEKMGIRHVKVFTKELLGNGVYQSTKKDNYLWYKYGIQAFQKSFNNGN